MELSNIYSFKRKTPLLFELIKELFFYKLTIQKKKKLNKKVNKILSQVLSKSEIKLFNQQLYKLKVMLNNDALFTYNNDPSYHSLEEAIITSNGLYAVMVYRLSNVLHNMGIKIIPRLLSEYAHDVTGIDIHPEAIIGERFFIDHGTGIVIGSTTVIGDNCKLYHGVTLGAKSLNNIEEIRKTKRHPTLKDNVTIYCNSTVLGGDTVIGEGCIIGANKLVIQSIEKNTRVI